MREIHEKAYAKLNISLDVTGRRSDGFHDMVMVMQTVSLCDELRITLNDSGTVRARSNLSFIPSDERNLAVKAAHAYFRAIGEEGRGAEIVMEKVIPVGAGMAGGSSDAAAVLRGLDTLYGNRLGREGLTELAAAVGSDVAFCVAGGTALATGRGEKLMDLPELPQCSFVICKPDFSISTPELFRKLDQSNLRRHPDTVGILNALAQGQLTEICRRMYNVFEDVDDRRLRTVSEIKSIMLDGGALGAIMTGTGSAVFGIFQQEDKAESAASLLGKDYNFVCTARPVPCLF